MNKINEGKSAPSKAVTVQSESTQEAPVNASASKGMPIKTRIKAGGLTLGNHSNWLRRPSR